MRYFFITLMILLSGSVFAAMPDSSSLAKSVADLNDALINKDTVKLKKLLKDDVHYYHSNGWVELKRDMVQDLYNGKLNYKQINVTSQSILARGNMGQVRMMVDIDVTMMGRPVQIKLDVYQQWVWVDNGWKLVARKGQKV